MSVYLVVTPVGIKFSSCHFKTSKLKLTRSSSTRFLLMENSSKRVKRNSSNSSSSALQWPAKVAIDAKVKLNSGHELPVFGCKYEQDAQSHKTLSWYFPTRCRRCKGSAELCTR